MAEYSLRVKGQIELSDYSNINDYLNIVGNLDKFTAVIDKNDAKNIEIISRILLESGFCILSKSLSEYGNTEIEALREISIS